MKLNQKANCTDTDCKSAPAGDKMKTATILFVLVLVFIIGCDEANMEEVSEVKKVEDKEMTFNEIDSVISSEEVRKALLELIFKVDTIPNPFGRSMCYFLSFYTAVHLKEVD